jgi:hypothetical protein
MEEEITLFEERLLKEVNVSCSHPYQRFDIIMALSKILSHPLCLLKIS